MPTTYNNTLHTGFTLGFCLFGIMHLTFCMCRGVAHPLANAVLLMGITGLVLVAIPKFLVTGLWFWAKECMGLTGIIWYTPILVMFGGLK